MRRESSNGHPHHSRYSVRPSPSSLAAQSYYRFCQAIPSDLGGLHRSRNDSHAPTMKEVKSAPLGEPTSAHRIAKIETPAGRLTPRPDSASIAVHAGVQQCGSWGLFPREAFGRRRSVDSQSSRVRQCVPWGFVCSFRRGSSSVCGLLGVRASRVRGRRGHSSRCIRLDCTLPTPNAATNVGHGQ